MLLRLLVFACLATIGHGRRVKNSLEQSPAELDEPRERARCEGAVHPMNAFAKLLLSIRPAAAFSPSGTGMVYPLGKTSLPRSHPCGFDSSSEDPPTTLLGGFLGAGKTTALTHMLTNRAGLKIAVLVNDVASVNVDAATMRRRTIEVDGVETVELENGCVCCGPGAGELAPAVKSLCARRAGDGSPVFDHVVVELSGVADPTNVQNNLRLGSIDVARKVALVDANAFPALYNSASVVGERKDLTGDPSTYEPCFVNKRVIELLLAQIETADVILVNKVDLASADELRTTLVACRALNPEAEIVSTTYGDAELQAMLPFEQLVNQEQGEHADQEHDNADGPATACSKPQRTESTHDHSHQSVAADCTEPDCTNPSHGHAHSHAHSHTGSSCSDPDCTHPSHDLSHSHEHSHAADSSCSDPLCTDPAHDHDYGAVPNSAESLGFQTYVYRARRPFSQRRLVSLVNRWPLPQKVLSTENIASPGADGVVVREGERDLTFANVLRSKGTVWLDVEHRGYAEWSHAGRHFTLSPGGPWWVTLPPEVMRAALSSSGKDAEEESDAYKAEFSKIDGEFGDRRQELVFIGTNLDTSSIEHALDDCLLTDEEMKEYQVIWSVEDERVASQNGPLRFPVGTKVKCNTGDDGWKMGVILKQYYREAEWPAEHWKPYQVQLDVGEKIWAPADTDAVIQAA